MKIVVLNGQHNRSKRLFVKKATKNGWYKLRVVGSEATGFRLAAEYEGVIYVFGFVYTKQTHAVLKGEQKYGQKAVKYAPNNSRKKQQLVNDEAA